MYRETDITYFVSFCIEQYKKAKGIGGQEAAALIFTSGASSYLAEHFDVLHTQSHQWIVEEIDSIIGRQQE